MTTWRDLIAASGLPRAEAQLLAAHVMGKPRSWMLAHDDDGAAADAADAARALFARRQKGEPVAYILGEREFYSLMFAVTPAVLIPRPETELLVDLALERLPEVPHDGSLLDIGTGSGAIAVAIAHARPDIEVWACDISSDALGVARANALRHCGHGARIHFEQSDLLDAFAGRRFNVIVSNPPYIAAGDPHLSEGDLRREPQGALVSGADGLALIRRLVSAAASHLQPGGWLLFEHGYDQGLACNELMQSLNYRRVITNTDLAGQPRVCAGQVADLT